MLSYLGSFFTNKNEEVKKLVPLVKENLVKLTNHLSLTYPNDERVKLIKSRFDPNVITIDDLGVGGYVREKGSEFKIPNNIYHLNAMMHVCIHLYAFLSTDEQNGHTAELWDNLQFLYNESVKIKICENPPNVEKMKDRFVAMTV